MHERNIYWLPLACPCQGTWPTTQACALTRNQTGDLWFAGQHPTHQATPVREYVDFFKNKYSKYIFLKVFIITFYFLQLPIRLQYIIHITYKICVNQLFMLSGRLPVNSRLLVVKFWRVKRYPWICNCMGVGTPNPRIVGG